MGARLSVRVVVSACACGTGGRSYRRHSLHAAAARLEGAVQIVCCARAEAGVVARHPRLPMLPVRGAVSGRQCVCRLTELK